MIQINKQHLQQDYLLRQIDQLGQVLAKILGNLLGLKSQGELTEGWAIASQALKTELDMDVDELIQISPEEFISTLHDVKKFNDDNFDKLADILLILAEDLDNRDVDTEKRNRLYERSLILFNYLNSTGSLYSFDRHHKIEKIKKSCG